MGKQEESPLQVELRQGEKKLSKRKRRLQERLQKALRAKKRAEERLQRIQARLQKRADRVQRLEEKLSDIRRQLQEIRTRPAEQTVVAADREDAGRVDTDTLVSFEESLVVPLSGGEGEMRVNDEAATLSSMGQQRVDLATLAESIVVAQDARRVAEAAEDAARLAIERAQAAESRLNQFGTARHLEHELAQMQVEANQAVQYARETEQTAHAAEEAIWPIRLQDVDEESESESEFETYM